MAVNIYEVHGPPVAGVVATTRPAVGPIASAAVKTGVPVMGSVKAIVLLAVVCFPEALTAMTVASYFPPGMSPATTVSGFLLVTTIGLALGWPEMQVMADSGMFQRRTLHHCCLCLCQAATRTINLKACYIHPQEIAYAPKGRT